MRRELIPLVVALALTACTLDHNGLGAGGDDVPDHVGLDVESGMDVALDGDAEVGFDAETGVDVPAEIAVETGVDVQPDLPGIDVPVMVDTATTCGSSAQTCCTPATPACVSDTNLCLTNDRTATSCAPCGGAGEPCCTSSAPCRDAGFTCSAVALFGVDPTTVCLSTAAAAGMHGARCAGSVGGGGETCGAGAACLATNLGGWCFRCGEFGGFCCPTDAAAPCESGSCETTSGALLPFCR